MQDPVKVNIFQSLHRNPVITYCQGPFFKLGWLGCCCGSNQPASGWFHSISQRIRLNQHCRWLTAGQRLIGSCPEGGGACIHPVRHVIKCFTLYFDFALLCYTWVSNMGRVFSESMMSMCLCNEALSAHNWTLRIETQVTAPLQRLNINFKHGLKILSELKNDF